MNWTDPTRTVDGVTVAPGLRVIDYDWKWGEVEAPSCPCRYSKNLHGETDLCQTWDGWWIVARDEGGTSLMDGTRLATRNVGPWASAPRDPRLEAEVA